ncbi:hypothetical protein HYFRA_00009434 [Hymenoscyphus fraxineus]|uniref:Uncharacterized protein n=1 Tax=Hymenoscyphus fraxineus TaxID=746836 RepID=A0A9N9PX30_9HELO|nr:hypothetical protein HYFRA_00009434 [Hymenoscyphus fraxineus]
MPVNRAQPLSGCIERESKVAVASVKETETVHPSICEILPSNETINMSATPETVSKSEVGDACLPDPLLASWRAGQLDLPHICEPLEHCEPPQQNRLGPRQRRLEIIAPGLP